MYIYIHICVCDYICIDNCIIPTYIITGQLATPKDDSRSQCVFRLFRMWMGLKWIECIQLLVFYDVVICCLLIETYHVDSCGVYTPATTLTTTHLSQSVFHPQTPRSESPEPFAASALWQGPMQSWARLAANTGMSDQNVSINQPCAYGLKWCIFVILCIFNINVPLEWYCTLILEVGCVSGWYRLSNHSTRLRPLPIYSQNFANGWLLNQARKVRSVQWYCRVAFHPHLSLECWPHWPQESGPHLARKSWHGLPMDPSWRMGRFPFLR